MPPDTTFCGQCGAPQVRVPEALITPPPPGIGDDSPISDAVLARARPGALIWRHALPAASAAGFAMAVASVLPLFSVIFPLWMLGGGWLAALLYRRRTQVLLLSRNVGGKIGALAGLIGFAFFAIFTSAYLTIATLVLHQGAEIRSMLRATLDQAAASNHDPRVLAISQWMQTPEGLAMIITFSMFLFLIAFLLLSTAGGIFGAAYSRKKMR